MIPAKCLMWAAWMLGVLADAAVFSAADEFCYRVRHYGRWLDAGVMCVCAMGGYLLFTLLLHAPFSMKLSGVAVTFEKLLGFIVVALYHGERLNHVECWSLAGLVICIIAFMGSGTH